MTHPNYRIFGKVLGKNEYEGKTCNLLILPLRLTLSINIDAMITVIAIKYQYFIKCIDILPYYQTLSAIRY